MLSLSRAVQVRGIRDLSSIYDDMVDPLDEDAAAICGDFSADFLAMGRSIWEACVIFILSRIPYLPGEDGQITSERILPLDRTLFQRGPPKSGDRWARMPCYSKEKFADLPDLPFARSAPTPMNAMHFWRRSD